MEWRIYYSDDTAFDGDAETVPDAPAVGVQVIVQFDTYTEHWYMQHSSDNYIWQQGRWLGVDDTGRTTYLVTPGWKRVLFGATIRNHQWQAIFAAAMGYRDQLDREHTRPGNG